MTSEIVQRAICTLQRQTGGDPRSPRYSGESRPAIVVVNGVRFASLAPENAGEAQSYNRAAEDIIRRCGP